ncbi:MAG: shikimate dehydrogenase [Pseudomonadota bacterium]
MNGSLVSASHRECSATSGPRAFVAGWPIAHSRSPLIHRHWLAEFGIAGDYVPQAVEMQALDDFLGTLQEAGFVGGNITVPLKQAAFATLHHCEPEGVAVGAVNTVWLEDGQLNGTNTDLYGFMQHLKLAAPQWDARDGTAVVLGAGGAARGVIYALLNAGVPRVVVVNRTRARADSVCAYFGNGNGNGHAGQGIVISADWGEAERLLQDAVLLVNTTSLGMQGSDPLNLNISGMRPGGTVYDIVYVPLETPLLAAARAQGLATVDGLGMLLHQAVPGFERWFGVRPTVTPELRQLIIDDLTKAAPAQSASPHTTAPLRSAERAGQC